MSGEIRNDTERFDKHPGIRISSKWNKIYIFKSTIEVLGRPQYVQMLIHPEKRLLAIKGSEKNERDTFLVPPRLFDNAVCEFKMESKLLTQQICDMAGWESGYAYRISGTRYPHVPVVVFELKKAERIS